MVFNINFNLEKNELLKATRKVCFDDVIKAIAADQILADINHPNNKRINQRIYIVKINNYAYAVPHVINEKKKEFFFKTVYPSRVFTKKYLKGGQ